VHLTNKNISKIYNISYKATFSRQQQQQQQLSITAVAAAGYTVSAISIVTLMPSPTSSLSGQQIQPLHGDHDFQ